MRLTRSAALTLVVALTTSCHLVDRAVSTELEPTATHEGSAPLTGATLSPAPMVGSGTSTTTVGEASIAVPGALTAALPPTEDHPTIVATADGRIHRIEADGSATEAKLAPLKGKPDSYRMLDPPGFIADDVTVLLADSKEGIFAVTAGAGARLSEDGGKTFRDYTWTPRFSYLDGSRPLVIDDLLINPEGLVAFLFYPEGVERAYANLDELLAAEEQTTERGGGPLLCTGQTLHQRTECRALPIGRKHELLDAPGRSILWVMIEHPQRHEMTRWATPDWGIHFIDNGYFDFRLIEATGSDQRVAFIGYDEDGQLILWMQGRRGLGQRALLDLPRGRLPTTLHVEDTPDPTRAFITRGTTAAVYDLSDVGTDVRLFWYYLFIGPLILVGGLGILRRALHERKLKKEWADYYAAARKRALDPTQPPTEPEGAAPTNEPEAVEPKPTEE